MGIFELLSKKPLITPAMIDTSSIPGAVNAEVVAASNTAVADPALIGQDGDLTLLIRVILRPQEKSRNGRTPFYFWHEGILVTCLGQPEKADDPESLIIGPDGEMHQRTVSYLVKVTCSKDIRTVRIHPVGLLPQEDYEGGGVEDPRVVYIKGWRKWLAIYTAVGINGICVAAAATADFESWERLGIIFGPSNKNAHPLPEKIKGEWFWLHRPDSSDLASPSIWISAGHELLRPSGFWPLARPRKDVFWERERIGTSGPAIKISPDLAEKFLPAYAKQVKQGGSWWLILYHGKERKGKRYCQGFMLVRFKNSHWQIMAQSREPAMTPDIFNGFSGPVLIKDAIFCCGHVFQPNEGRLIVAVSRADTDLWFAQTTLDQINQNLVPVSR